MTPLLFLTVFGSYVLAMIGLSIWIARRQKSGEDILLGNRSIPLLLSLGTTIATLVGTGSTIGAVGQGYLNGWRGAMYGVGGGVGMLLLVKLFSNVRTHNFMTMSEEVSFYYGANRRIKGLVAVFILLASIGWLGAHILGGSFYLAYIGNMDPLWAKVVLASGFSIYVIIGGYVAVVWTDTIQAIVLFLGFILMAFFALSSVGGLSKLGNLAGDQLNFLRGDNLLPSI
jgi:SSS family solute:Na+ symporter